jgi:HAD superfamily hydrolase (TIGR01549 family)
MSIAALAAPFCYHRVMTVRAVIFDLGHTLWDLQSAADKMPSLYRGVRHRLVQSLDGDVPAETQLQQAVEERFLQEDIAYLTEGKLEQPPTRQLIGEALRGLGIAADERLVIEITDMILGADVFRIRVDRSANDTLAALKKRGLRLGVVSNTYGSGAVIRQQLAEHGSLPYFGATIFSSEAGVRKPHPAIFRAALEELRVSPEEAVFVGDSLIADVWGAQALGMRAVLSHQYRQEDPRGPSPDAKVQGLKAWLDGRPPDHIIERLAEIVGYVDGVNSSSPPP